MQEITGNIWDSFTASADAWVGITTNGFINKSGQLVMGKGIALEAKIRYPDLPEALGYLFSSHAAKGGKTPPGVFYTWVELLTKYRIFTFPVKHHWSEPAAIGLIESSCVQLKDWIAFGDRKELFKPETQFLLVRPGCGNGNLSWEVVRPILIRYFEEEPRLIIVDREL